MPTLRDSVFAWLAAIAAGAITGCRTPQDEHANHTVKAAETPRSEAASAPATTTETSCPPLLPPPPSPSDAELRRLAVAGPAALGSLSLGRPQDGALVGGVKLEDDPRWQVTAPSNAWATTETLQYLTRALCVALQGSPPFYNPVAQHRGRVVHDLVARGVPRAPPGVVPPRRLPPPR